MFTCQPINQKFRQRVILTPICPNFHTPHSLFIDVMVILNLSRLAMSVIKETTKSKSRQKG